MKIALTDAGVTIVHLVHPTFGGMTRCYQFQDGRVAHQGTEQDVDCMTCLVRASERTLEVIITEAMHLPKRFLYGESESESESESDNADRVDDR